MSLAASGFIRTWCSQPSGDELHGRRLFEPFDPVAVNVLNDILQKTDAEIVVSSDWKRHVTVEEMGDFYISQGINKRPFDFTPWLTGYPTYHQQRAAEIHNWLETCPEITIWAAVDDLHMGIIANNTHRSWGLANFVWTENIQTGITEPTIIKAILKYLGY